MTEPGPMPPESAASGPTPPELPPPAVDRHGDLDLTMHVGPLYFDAHRVVYATIILMTAYALFDEGDDPFGAGPMLELFGLSLAPLFALAMAHAFSEALDLQIRYRRRLTLRDRRHLAATNLQYLYVAIPPMILTALLSLTNMPADDIVGIVQLVGIGSLAWWGVYAARKARLGVWAQIRFGLNYAIMGFVIIIVELILTH